jgi:hypothetical protein
MTGSPLLVKLWETYWEATLFAAMHVFVLLTVLWSAFQLWREARAVRKWMPMATVGNDPSGASGAVSNSRITNLLDSFTAQAAVLGQRGIFLPLNDYSDRIDAFTESMVSSLHDRIHMFLLVGIAGTLSGLFQFASDTEAALTADTVGTALASAMETAFPVGVVGLGLMLISLMLAVFPEGALHKAVADATRRALDERGSLTSSTQDRVEKLIETFNASLLPLANLGNTFNNQLVGALGGVFKSLHSVLERQSAALNSHVATLEDTTDNFRSATEALVDAAVGLKDPLAAMTESVRDVPDILARSAQIQEELMTRGQQIQAELLQRGNEVQQSLLQESSRIQERSSDMLRSTVSIYDEAAKTFAHTISTASDVTVALSEVHGKLSDLPDAIVKGAVEGARESFVAVGLQSEQFWRNSFDTLRQDVQGELAAYVGALRSTADEINITLHAAAEEMQRLASNSSQVITGPVRTIVDHGKDQILGVLDRISDLVAQAAPTAERLTHLAEVARVTTESLQMRESSHSAATLVRADRTERDRLADVLERLEARPHAWVVPTATPLAPPTKTIWERIRGAGASILRRRG